MLAQIKEYYFGKISKYLCFEDWTLDLCIVIIQTDVE